MVFIWRVWEHKLITSTLQLGKLIYHKPNSYDSVLRQWNLSDQSVYEKVSQLSTSLSVSDISAKQH